MKITVVGLWHLGTVTAACLASSDHTVIGLDTDSNVINDLTEGRTPIFEPGLEKLVKKGLSEKHLNFTTNTTQALYDAEIVWITYDTPVDDSDRADVTFVKDQIVRLFPYLPLGALVLISSQLPVGTTRKLKQIYLESNSTKPVSFGYSPENLRLGQAIKVFTHPDRVVVGLQTDSDRRRITELFKAFTEHIEWMSIESAEMTKHALNAWLATSVVFINEVASLCEVVGADAKEVERGLKSEARIGSRAYLSPGGAFGGGTLARDVEFLKHLGKQHQLPLHLWNAVKASNESHKHWTRHKLLQVFNELHGRCIAVWGLTYKPGTDTLRRSTSVELCRWLAGQGAQVRVHDPAVKSLPSELCKKIELCFSFEQVLVNAEVLVVATEWPDYLDCNEDLLIKHMTNPVVIDANRFLASQLDGSFRIRYLTIGRTL